MSPRTRIVESEMAAQTSEFLSSLGADKRPSPVPVKQHIVEFVSDSGEGAQTAGQFLGAVSARMGNGIWTVEIIPAQNSKQKGFTISASSLPSVVPPFLV